MTPLEILRAYKVFAIVGLSDRPSRPSTSVASFLKERGYHIVPVNPRLAGREILGESCYADLESIPFPVDVVDIFRRSELVSPIVDQAIAIRARVVWMQLGVIDERSAQRARAAGLEVVMDRCPAIELRRAAETGL